MNLYPQDLGLKRHIGIVRLRALGMSGGSNAGLLSVDLSERRLGLLERFWVRGTGVEPRAAAAAFSAMRNLTMGFAGGMIGGSSGFLAPAIIMATQGMPVGALFMGLGGSIMAGLGLLMPRVWFRGLNGKPVTVSEIEALLPTVHDDLERAYLTTVIDAVRQSVEGEAEKEIRTALHALGAAIDRLPTASGPVVDTGVLRREAADVQAKARAETDRVIADSLERRADALHRRADANDRSALLVRRAAALREELAAQTEALRAGLFAFNSGATDIASLSHLAEAVRGVAAEAVSVADARAELEGDRLPPPPSADAEQPKLRLGRQ